jgi:hypothetical protein
MRIFVYSYTLLDDGKDFSTRHNLCRRCKVIQNLFSHLVESIGHNRILHQRTLLQTWRFDLPTFRTHPFYYSDLDLIIRFKSDYVENFNISFNLDIKTSACLELLCN